MTRHPNIIHWRDIEEDAPWSYDGSDEPMTQGAALGRHFGLKRIGVHHERLVPGRRTSFPHAESTEDELIFVLTGTPDVWLDGHLHRLAPGDCVGFPAGDGLSHTFLNNTDQEVTLIVVGDRTRDDNKIVYPLNPEQRPRRTNWWDDVPKRPLGPHDGLTDARRAALKAK